MATRNSVLTKITAINDKGNNSAAEVRDVLTELLDYTENKTELVPFHIFSENAIWNFTTNANPSKSARLFFSLKGIKGETANMTLLILAAPQKENTSNEIVFAIPFDQDLGMFTKENFDLLAGNEKNGIIPLINNQMMLIYQVPIYSTIEIDQTQTQMQIFLVANHEIYKNGLIILFSKFNSGIISTSIAMHSHRFDLKSKDNNEVITGGGKSRKSSTQKGSESEFTKFFEKLFS